MLENKAKIAVDSRLITRFSKLPLLLSPLTYIPAGNEVIEYFKRVGVGYLI